LLFGWILVVDVNVRMIGCIVLVKEKINLAEVFLYVHSLDIFHRKGIYNILFQWNMCKLQINT
jgi:hypothetical protein